MTGPVLVALAACVPGTPETVDLGHVRIDLFTPAAVDPLEGADALVVTVRDANGAAVARFAGTPEDGVVLPGVDRFGLVNIEVTAEADGRILAAARTGPVLITEGIDLVIPAIFLPINEAIRVDTSPREERLDHVTYATADGRVVLIGGRQPSSSIVFDDSEIWDPQRGFETGPDLPGPVYAPASTLLDDGSIVIAGGRTAQTPDSARSNLAFRLDSDAGLETLPSLVHARDSHCLARFGDDLIAIGGRGVYGDRTVEVLRSGANAWVEIAMDALVTENVTGCLGTARGKVVTIGADASAWGVLDIADATDDQIPSSFTALPSAPAGLDGALLVPDREDVVLALGGFDGQAATTEGRGISGTSGAVGDAVSLGTPRAWGSWRWWEADRIIAVGGGFSDGARSQAVKSVELVDILSGPMLAIDVPLKDPRLEVLAGGVIVLTGGLDDRGEAGGAWAIVPWP